MAEFDFKIISTEEELKEYFKIRNDIFVKEQNIFSVTDPRLIVGFDIHNKIQHIIW